MPQKLGDLGYETIVMRPSVKTFHNSFAFESYHGTKRFFDRAYYDQFEDEDRYGSWGALSDGPFLRQVIQDLGEVADSGPFFADVLTISTHYPHPWQDRDNLPSAVRNLKAAYPKYANYLNALHYSDQAVGHFVQALFDTDFGANSLLVLLGDHSINVAPPEPLEKRQKTETRYRIPLAFLSKNIRAPLKITSMAHQVDVAPTILSLLGQEAPSTWLGKDLFSSAGSAWVAHDNSGLSFRTEQLSCYGSSSFQWDACFQISPNDDPMWSSQLPTPDQHLAPTWNYFDQLVRANQWMIRNNQVRKLESP